LYINLSIIIPVYNREKLVCEALDSVLAQTSPKWECIVVDDGSTDKTWDVLSKYAAKDSRVRIFQRDREPKGASRCRNMGAELSIGDYLFFLDSDDLVGKTFVETRLKYIAKYPAPDFLVFPEVCFEKSPDKDCYPGRQLFAKEDDLIRFFKWDNPWITSGPVWRKTSFLKLKGFNEVLECGQDWEMNVRALLSGLSYLKISTDVDLYMRRNPDESSIGNNILRNKQFEKVYKNKIRSIESITGCEKCLASLHEDKRIRKAFTRYFVRLSSEMVRGNNITMGKELWHIMTEKKLIPYIAFLYWNVWIMNYVQKNTFLNKRFYSFSYRLWNLLF